MHSAWGNRLVRGWNTTVGVHCLRLKTHCQWRLAVESDGNRLLGLVRVTLNNLNFENGEMFSLKSFRFLETFPNNCTGYINLRILCDMIWYISNGRDSRSYRCVFMVEIQSWAGQACFGISFWEAWVNIINRIYCQNLSVLFWSGSVI